MFSLFFRFEPPFLLGEVSRQHHNNLKAQKTDFFLPNSTHMPHGTGIFTYIYHKNQPNVDKFTSLMDLIKVGICFYPGNFVKKAVILGEHCQIARVDLFPY